MSLLPVDIRARIDVSFAEGWLVVNIRGAELFDLVDDYLTRSWDADARCRLPVENAEVDHSLHSIFLPASVGYEKLIQLLVSLPLHQARAAIEADDASRCCLR